jgi:hypothetical protein
MNPSPSRRWITAWIIGIILLMACPPTIAQSGKFTPGQSGLAERIRANTPFFRDALRVHKQRIQALMDRIGVHGTAVTADRDGRPVIEVFVSPSGHSRIPDRLDGIPVRIRVMPLFRALQDTGTLSTADRWPRPVPIGVSAGHPAITAGTIGARVTDGHNVFALSNNHVFAAINSGRIGDPVLQPGAVDDGTTPDDVIGTLYDYQPLNFCSVFWIWLICPDVNRLDAALVDVFYDDPLDGDPFAKVLVDTATPANGYGAPSPELHDAYGLPDVIGDAEENLAALIDTPVQKYGRTTQLTFGTVTHIGATMHVAYGDEIAQFEDQIIISAQGFSGGGDSGSLVVTRDGNHPVGLMFAGGDNQTLANRIDLVLNHFGVTMDSRAPAELTAIEVTPASATIELDQTQQFTATGVYSDGSENDITDAVEWAVSNSDPPVATIQSGGLATGKNGGTTSVTASFEGMTGSATLTVIAASLIEITISPSTLTMQEGDTQQFSATGFYDDGTTRDLTSEVAWISDNPGIVSIDETGLSTAQSTGETFVSADLPGLTSNFATVTVEAGQAPVASPHIQAGEIDVSAAGWTPVNLDHDYGDQMVVVCSLSYRIGSVNTDLPLIAHVRNASGSRFEVAVFGADALSGFQSATVYWVAAEAGVYTEPEHGIKMEAVKFDSDLTDNYRSWVGHERTYGQSYQQPVVVGQVMSMNSDFWSVFWSRGSSRQNPPSVGSLWVGKHKGEDFLYTRTPETIGYLVVEAGTGAVDGFTYQAALGPDTLRGAGDAPPYAYSLTNEISSQSIPIVSQSGMDGANGGWAILYGSPKLPYTLNLAIEEDQFLDYERKHTTEQVGYVIFTPAAAESI